MSLVKEEKSWLEWVVFWVSSVLIVSLVGYLVRDSVLDQERPPDIRINLDSPYRSTHGFMVPVSVTNLGDRTAQNVEIEVRCTEPNGQTQDATLTYDFLASGEVKQGCVGFFGEPAGRLSPRVVGYRSD